MTSSGRRIAVPARWQQHTDILVNAATLLGTAVVTSGLGVVFWGVAARMLSRDAVGYGSAAVSAMTLLGTVGMFGLGTLLLGELPRREQSRSGMVTAALVVAGGGSLLLGLGYAAVVPVVAPDLGDATVGTVPLALLFSVGVAVTAVAFVFDQAVVGLLRGGLQLWRNAVFAIAKLVLLVVLAAGFVDPRGVTVTLSWVAGTVLSLAFVALLVRHQVRRLAWRPRFATLRGLGRATAAHTWLNLALQVPRLLLPVLVAASISATANSTFYLVWMLAGVLYLVPTQLSTVLFTVAAGDPRLLSSKLRFTLRISGLAGVVGVLLLGVGAHLVLLVFGPEYAASGTLPLQLLVLGYAPTVVRVHYVAVSRARGTLSRAAALVSAAACVEVAAAYVGGQLGGVTGVCVGILAAFTLEGLVMTAPVWRAARAV